MSPVPLPEPSKREEAIPGPPEGRGTVVEYNGMLWLFDGYQLIEPITEDAA
jgi:hypothetical protein